MAPIDRALLDEAVELARRAGEVTLGWFRRPDLAVAAKGDGTPVTEADRAAERFLRRELARRHPGDAVVGEEEEPSPGSTGRTWVVDPIDGTKAFTRGVPLYATLLAVHDDEGPAVGVIHLPGLGETVYAGRGLGCFADGAPARVGGRGELAGSCVCTSGLATWPAGHVAALGRAGVQLRTWGDGYGFALVATGRVEAMVDPEVSLWDVAPMPVIMAEAGGRYGDLAGSTAMPLEPGRPLSAVASNGAVHDELLALLAR